MRAVLEKIFRRIYSMAGTRRNADRTCTRGHKGRGENRISPQRARSARELPIRCAAVARSNLHLTQLEARLCANRPRAQITRMDERGRIARHAEVAFEARSSRSQSPPSRFESARPTQRSSVASLKTPVKAHRRRRRRGKRRAETYPCSLAHTLLSLRYGN